MKPILLTLLLAPLTVANPSLNEQLQAFNKEVSTKFPAEVRQEFANGIKAVEEAHIVDQAKKAGDTAPDFTLKNPKGEDVKLSELLKKGPVVLTWYRGGWCPYCNLALNALQKELPAIQKAGAQLVALTPELPDKSLETTEKNKLQFQVLTDTHHKVAKEYGIVFKLTPKVRDIYKGLFDLNEYNGKEAGDDTLPLAATYVIGTDGNILWAFLDADYRKRAEPSDIVKFLTQKNPQHTTKP